MDAGFRVGASRPSKPGWLHADGAQPRLWYMYQHTYFFVTQDAWIRANVQVGDAREPELQWVAVGCGGLRLGMCRAI